MPGAAAAAKELAAAGIAALELVGLGNDSHADSLRRFHSDRRIADGPPRRLLAERRDLLNDSVRRIPDWLPGMAAAMAAADEHATWTEYAPSEWAQPFVERMAAGFLVGPTAPVVSYDVSFGMFVVAPNTFYREHGHPAREVYVVVSGRTEFLSSDGWITLGPGDASVQEPEVTHALRTGSEGMLCFWAWTGDVSSAIWGFDQEGNRFIPQRRDQ